MSNNRNGDLADKYKRQTRLYQLISLFLLVGCIAMGLHLGWKVKRASLNTYPLINPARQYISQDDFIVNIQPLRQELGELVAKEKDIKISLYYEQLNTGANISINQDMKLHAASLTKLPEAMIVAKKVEMGEWDWDNQLILTQGDIDRGSGGLYHYPLNSRFTIEKLLEEMLVNSDNTAERIIYRNIKDDDTSRLIGDVGLEDLYNMEGKMSAKEYSRLYRALYSASFLNRENSTKILKFLSAAKFKDYLSSGLPEDIVFAHKYGENKEYRFVGDSGIVYFPNRPYLFTVMMELPDSTDESRDRAKYLMKEISIKAYEFMSFNH
jgi:beta-lactamase class A